MKLLCALPLVLALVGLHRADPQDLDPATARPAVVPGSPLEAFAPLVGKRWRGTFPDGALHDVQEFEWMLGGKFLRNVHRVTTPDGGVVYEGETVYGWDHASGEVRWWYFNSTGGHVVGTAVPMDGAWLAQGDNHGPAGQTARVRSEMRIGEDDWTSTSYFLQDEEWKERFTMRFAPVEPEGGGG